MIIMNSGILLLLFGFAGLTTVHGAGFKLFGTLSTIAPDEGTLSIVIIIIAVLITEYLFEYLHVLTHDTPFQDMVTAIEQELMIVGSMAFLFKIIINITVIQHDLLIGLEYADIFIPLVSFCFCLQGLFFILISIRQCSLWSKAFHLTLDEVLFEYYGIDDHKPDRESLDEIASTSISQWIASFKTQLELEFKVFHELFCDQFKILNTEFQFDLYVERVYEKYLLEIITITPLDWFIVVILAALNYGRLQLGLEYGSSCDRHGHHNYEYHACQDKQSIRLFCFLGVAVLGVSFLLALVSRIYERRLLRSRGVEGLGDCIVFLRYAETQPKESVVNRRLSSEDLKGALHKIKLRQLRAKDHQRKKRIQLRRKKSGQRNTLDAAFTSDLHRASVVPTLTRMDEGGPAYDVGAGSAHPQVGDSFVLPLVSDASHSTSTMGTNAMQAFPDVVHKKRGWITTIVEGLAAIVGGGRPPVGPGHTKKASGMSMSISNFALFRTSKAAAPTESVSKKAPSAPIKRKKADVGWENPTGKQIGEDVVKIFWLSNPRFYFSFVKVQVMIVSCYMSLWLTNYVVVAGRMHQEAALWEGLIGLPVLLCLALNMYIVRCAALLKAVSSLDKDIVEEVIEHAEASKNLSISLRNKIIDKLGNVLNPAAELKLLFDEIDENGSNSLSRAEFQVFLHDLNITFSRKKWEQIFKEIDRNFDDKISVEELYLFIFPDHNQARNSELMRIRRIRRKVQERTKSKSGFAKTIRPALLDVASDPAAVPRASSHFSGHTSSAHGAAFGRLPSSGAPSSERSLKRVDEEKNDDSVRSTVPFERYPSNEIAGMVKIGLSDSKRGTNSTHGPPFSKDEVAPFAPVSIKQSSPRKQPGVESSSSNRSSNPAPTDAALDADYRQQYRVGSDEDDVIRRTGSRSLRAMRNRDDIREAHLTDSFVFGSPEERDDGAGDAGGTDTADSVIYLSSVKDQEVRLDTSHSQNSHNGPEFDGSPLSARKDHHQQHHYHLLDDGAESDGTWWILSSPQSSTVENMFVVREERVAPPREVVAVASSDV